MPRPPYRPRPSRLILMAKFWDDATSALSTRLFGAGDAALVFWAWAATVWVIHQGGWPYFVEVTEPLFADGGLSQLVVWAVIAVIAVLVSSTIVGFLTLPVLRLLEGYWPGRLFAKVRDSRVEQWTARALDLSQSAPANRDVSLAVDPDVELHYLPDDRHIMPTRIGNIIRAGETRPLNAYQLDPIRLWPQFWLVLPEHARKEIAGARDALDRSVRALIWCMIAALLGIICWPSAVVGLTLGFGIWRWRIPSAARDYSALLSAAFDTHRFDLYDALHFPRPRTPAEELRYGKGLTANVWSGNQDFPRRFAPTDPSPSKPAQG